METKVFWSHDSGSPHLLIKLGPYKSGQMHHLLGGKSAYIYHSLQMLMTKLQTTLTCVNVNAKMYILKFLTDILVTFSMGKNSIVHPPVVQYIAIQKIKGTKFQNQHHHYKNITDYWFSQSSLRSTAHIFLRPFHIDRSEYAGSLKIDDYNNFNVTSSDVNEVLENIMMTFETT